MEIEAPTIASFANATHNHEDGADGGRLTIWREIDTGAGAYSDGQIPYEIPCVVNHSVGVDMPDAEFYCRVAPADGPAVVTFEQAGANVATVTFTVGQPITTPGTKSSAGWAAVAGAGKFKVKMPAISDSAFGGFHGAMPITRYGT